MPNPTTGTTRQAMGARIVLTSFGSFGDVYPYLGLALALRERGHTPVLATLPFYRSHVEREGFEFVPIRPDLAPDDSETLRRVMDARSGTEQILRHVLMPHLRASYDDLFAATEGADLLVTHPVTFAGPLVAEKRGLPWLSSVLAPMSFFSAHELSVFPQAPWMIHLGRLGLGVRRALVSLAKRTTVGWMRPVAALRAELGLPPAPNPVFEGQFSPYGSLALFSRVLAAPQPDWPPAVHVTGFVFYDRSMPASPELDAFLERGDPPVVFTLGSSAIGAAGAVDFYEVSAAAARRLGIRAVLLTGHRVENRPREALPPEIIAVPAAPHSSVFPRAAAIVHQGGAGTLGQALRAGRPMLVVPHAHDQPDNAYRATRLGVARTLYPRRYTVDAVTAHLRTLLDDPSYAAQAKEVGHTVHAEDGARVATDAIEALLRSHSTITSTRRHAVRH